MQDEKQLFIQDNSAAFPGTKYIVDYNDGGKKKQTFYFGMNQRQYLAYKLAPELLKIMAEKSVWEKIKCLFRKRNQVNIPSGEHLAKVCYAIADEFVDFGKSQTIKHYNNE